MSAPSSNTVGIAGSGRIAQALGRLLRRSGSQIVVAGRDSDHLAQAAAFIGADRTASLSQLPRLARRVLIAVPDSAVTQVAGQLAQAGMEGGVVLHTCGSQGLSVLSSLTARGVSCGVLHPLQTVPTPAQGVNALVGAAFGISGEGAALDWANRIVVSLKGEALVVADEHRSRYHAAAVIAGNYVITAIDAAEELMAQIGVPPVAARRALGPLVRASAENALSHGAAKALTGPIERGDAGTVRNHLTALVDSPASIRTIYVAGACHALTIARANGLDPAASTRIEELLYAARQ